MAKQSEFTQIVVQRLPDAGLLVRFKASRLMHEEIVNKIREELLSLIAPERLLLFDLTNIIQMSSAFLGVLIRMQKNLRAVSGGMSICGMRPSFEELFRITRLDKTFEIYPDLESALRGSDADLV